MSTVDTETRCPVCDGYQYVLKEPQCVCSERNKSASPENARGGHRYRVTYTGKAHPEGISREDLPEGFGACDCLLVASILGQPGGPGGLSVQFASLNGFKGDGASLDPMQEFNIFSMFAHYLAEVLPSGSHAQIICQDTFERVQQLVLNNEASTLAEAIIVMDKLKKAYDGSVD